MQVSVETTSPIARRMTVTVPAEELEQAVASRLKRLSSQVKMPGFRPGKVPMKMVEAQYGQRVMQEATADLIQTSYQQALGQEQLKPAGGPKIEPKSLERGQALEYVAEFDVYPEIPQLSISGKAIERPQCEITDTDIDKTIETMRKQRVSWEPATAAAADGDRVTIDFVGTIDGEEFDGGKANDYQVVLGSGALLPDFEQGLIGVTLEQQLDLPVSFPADYPAAELAGKATRFAITVKAVEAPKLPVLDADFIRQLGTESGEVTQFRDEVKVSLVREAETRQRDILRRQVMTALLEANQFEIPRNLLDQEVQRLRKMDPANRQDQGLPQQNTDEANQAYEKTAQRRVALGLILSEVVQQQQLRADPEQVRARLTELAASYEAPQAFVQWHYEKPERLAEIESLVLEDKVVEHLLQDAAIKDKSVDFQALIELSKASQQPSK